MTAQERTKSETATPQPPADKEHEKVKGHEDRLKPELQLPKLG